VLIDVLRPHMKLAKVKPAHETANRVRVPSARDRKPESRRWSGSNTWSPLR
jgi:hypothetical protein